MDSHRLNSPSRRFGWLVAALVVVAIACVAGIPASAQTWVGTTDNNWLTGTNWVGGASPNGSGADASILAPLNNPVQLATSVALGTLTMGAGTSLDINSSGLIEMYGGSIANAGTIDLASGNSYIKLANDLTLTGTGTLVLSGGQIGADSYGRLLTNQSTIEGYGLIDSDAGPVYNTLNLANEGTINANSTGNTLSVGASGSFSNSGVLEATNGGTLSLFAGPAIQDGGGSIVSSGAGSTVNISTTVQGGTLTTNNGGVMQTSGTAYLDGSTHGAITLADGSTYTAGPGTTQMVGTFNLGTTTGSTLALSGELQLKNGDLTISGPGSVVMTGGQIGTDSYGRLLTNNSTIMGYGTINSNAGADYPVLNVLNNGVINANSSGNVLYASGNNSFINKGTLEATGGGTLDLVSGGSVIQNGSGSIIASGSGSMVNISTTIQGGTLTTSDGGVMQTAGTAYLDGSTQGAITLSDGSTYTAGPGTTQMVGTFNLGTSTGSTLAISGEVMLKNGDLTISGPGSVVMTGGQIGTDSYGRLLTNNSTIMGYGTINSNAGADYPVLNVLNNGVINANSTGNTLLASGSASFVNNKTLEATNGGILDLVAGGSTIQNGSGSIIASGAGSIVDVSTTIIGGSLTTNNGGVMQSSGYAALDGNAGDLGAITLTGGSTYTAGAGSYTAITGSLVLDSGSTLALGGQLRLTGDTTFSGPGVVVMSSTDGQTGQIGTDSYGRTLYNQTTIEGTGLIGSNAAYVYPALSVNNTGIINANVNAGALTLGSSSGTITNTGTFEATNGGILNLNTTPAINNNSGAILASGAGSTVNVNTTIQGGTLTTTGGGVMQSGTYATLDASSQGAITLTDASTYTAGAGTYTSLLGNLILGTTTGSTLDLGGQLRLTGDTTFSGPGAVVMNSTNGSTGQIGTDSYGRTLYNQTTIEGTGLIGSNASYVYPGLSVNNTGTINANVNGGTLGLGSTSGSITNTGLFEATNGGILNLITTPAINNNGGTILASGTGSTVNVNTTIQGGSLTTTGGGLMQTGTSNATLDGATLGAITITDGSTYTAGTNGLTSALGTINLGTSTGGTLALTPGAQLRLIGDLTLTGPGSLTLTSTTMATAQIGSDAYGRTLINESTIQGAGLIGSNVGSLYQGLNVNNASNGLILANAAGQTLQIGGTGSTTNSGTLQANAGSVLEVSNTLNNFSGSTLTGGTYYANGGTLQLNLGSNSAGGEIVTDAGHITVSGSAGAVNDLGNHNALSDLATVATNASLTLINGAQLSTAASTFTNSGTVTLGTGGSQLNVATGSFVQGSSATLVEEIGGSGGGQFGVTNINGTDTLAGTLDVDLVDGFTLAANTEYGITFMYSGGGDVIGAFSNVICPTNDSCTVVYDGPGTGDVTLDIDGPVQGTPPVPEPATFVMLFTGLASLAAGARMRRSRKAA